MKIESKIIAQHVVKTDISKDVNVYIDCIEYSNTYVSEGFPTYGIIFKVNDEDSESKIRIEMTKRQLIELYNNIKKYKME